MVRAVPADWLMIFAVQGYAKVMMPQVLQPVLHWLVGIVEVADHFALPWHVPELAAAQPSLHLVESAQPVETSASVVLPFSLLLLLLQDADAYVVLL